MEISAAIFPICLAPVSNTDISFGLLNVIYMADVIRKLLHTSGKYRLLLERFIRHDRKAKAGGKRDGPGTLPIRAYHPGYGGVGHEKCRVYKGRNSGMVRIGKTAYGIVEAGMKIIIGGQDIEIPQFIADAMKKPENDRQFHAFLRQVLTAQAGKIRDEVRKELEAISLSPLEKLNSFVSGFKGKRRF
jgi:hypothetical protein